MKPFPVAFAVAFAVFGAHARAQTPEVGGTRLALRDSSTLSLSGTSTLHDFTCRTNTIQALVEVDSGFLTASFGTLNHPMERVEITIPVTSLKCGHDGMDNNMYGTLRAKDYPTITYTLKSYNLDSSTVAADKFAAKTQGVLTIAGKSRDVAMTVQVTRDANGVSRATGSMDLKMSDFGIKPPKFFLGTLRVGDSIVIKFDLSADRAATISAGMLQP